MITIEHIEELMDMLTGTRLPKGMVMLNQPCLSLKQAFSVVWFLQEHLPVLPDNFEQCHVCLAIFDRDHGGCFIDKTDDVSSWQEEIGVTQEMLKAHNGAQFCSIECEAAFWDDVFENEEEIL
ncbi:hypothetical protein KKE60_06870 [Patescibacteria group bacterium]|nr:hypothetical protein [Patescibacteria group bacterium]